MVSVSLSRTKATELSLGGFFRERFLTVNNKVFDGPEQLRRHNHYNHVNNNEFLRIHPQKVLGLKRANTSTAFK